MCADKWGLTTLGYLLTCLQYTCTCIGILVESYVHSVVYVVWCAHRQLYFLPYHHPSVVVLAGISPWTSCLRGWSSCPPTEPAWCPVGASHSVTSRSERWKRMWRSSRRRTVQQSYSLASKLTLVTYSGYVRRFWNWGVCLYVRVCVHVCTLVCTCACVRACMLACMRVCVNLCYLMCVL